MYEIKKHYDFEGKNPLPPVWCIHLTLDAVTAGPRWQNVAVAAGQALGAWHCP